MTEAQERARLLWLEGRPTSEIATCLHISRHVVYRWRAALGWPKRPDPRGRVRPVIALAAALWADEVPRSVIAALCQVPIRRVDAWKEKYGWARRPPGLRARSRPMTVSKPLLRRARRLARVVAAPVAAPARRLTRWECCGQRTERESCAICHRPHPLLAA